MIPDRVTVSAGGVTYKLVIRGKFNVIVGLSASGKTRLTRVAEIARKQPQGNVGVPVIGDQSSLEFSIRNMRNCIIIIDEDVGRDRWRSLCRLMMGRPNIYIICTREGNRSIPYGIDTTFELVGGPDTYHMVPRYTKNICTRATHGISGVVCEDGKSGFEYIRQLCARLPIYSAQGKDKLVALLTRLPERQLVVFDTCGIGAAVDDLERMARSERAVLFDSRSFEYEVLTSLFTPFYTPYLQSTDPLKYPSEEEYYIKTLNSILSSPAFRIGYSKGNQQLVRLFLTKKGKVGEEFIDLRQYSREDSIPYEEIREEDTRQGGSSNESNEP